MKKQNLFFNTLFILAVLLILSQASLAIAPIPNTATINSSATSVNPDAAPMKIDVIKETEQGEEENSAQVNQKQTVPTAATMGSIKTVVMPTLLSSIEKIEECVNNSKTIDDEEIWSKCRNNNPQDNENEEVIAKLESCVLSYKNVDQTIDNELIWSKCKTVVLGETTTVVSSPNSAGMINPQPELTQEVSTNAWGMVENKEINPPAEPLGQTTITLVAPNELKPALETVMANNKNEMVKQVEINGSDITINYAQPVKLFGFIPINTNLEVTVNTQNKKVEVKTPWWLFLTSSNRGQVKNQIQTEINNETTVLSTVVSQQAVQSVNVVKNILKFFSSLTK